MYGSRNIESFSNKRGKFQRKFKDKSLEFNKMKKPQRDKPQHKRWLQNADERD